MHPGGWRGQIQRDEAGPVPVPAEQSQTRQSQGEQRRQVPNPPAAQGRHAAKGALTAPCCPIFFFIFFLANFLPLAPSFFLIMIIIFIIII